MLVTTCLKDRRTGKITIALGCEGVGDDDFVFYIMTGITNKDIANLRQKGKTITKEMGIRLMVRNPDPYLASRKR